MSLAYFTLLHAQNGEFVKIVDLEKLYSGPCVAFQDTSCVVPELYLTCQAGAKNHLHVVENFYLLAERHGISRSVLDASFNAVMSGHFCLNSSNLLIHAKACDPVISDDDLEDLLYDLILDSGYKHLELEIVYR